VRLAVLAAQERVIKERGNEELVEADLKPGTWGILREWEAAGPRLNKALRQARARLGLTAPADTYRLRPRDMGLPVEFREMMDDWERRALVEDRG
jgi:hypothetical protein